MQQLREMVVNGEVTANALVAMDAKQLASEEQKILREAAVSHAFDATRSDWERLNYAKIEEEYGIQNVNNFGKCQKCGGDRTTYTQKQMRSSDEPMTIFVTCINCGNRWRKG